MIEPRPLNRNQLSKFLTDHEAIKYFERLFDRVSETFPEHLSLLDRLSEENSIDANTALALAHSAQSELYELKKIYDSMKLEPALAQDTKPVVDSITVNQNAPTTGQKSVGETSWNKSAGTLDTVLYSGVTLQHGQELHQRFINNTVAPIGEGMVIAYDGPSSNPEAPFCKLFIADGSIEPHLIAGITTSAANPGEILYATWFGRVRNIDTTSFLSPLLYASADTPGLLTHIKPTAPDLSVICASVSEYGVSGVVLVRPTINTRLYYGSFSGLVDQPITAANTPYGVNFTNTEFASGFYIGATQSQVYAMHSGLFSFKFSLEITSSKSSPVSLFIWIRKNGVDVDNSASELVIKSNTEKYVPAWDYTLSMQPGDYFELMVAASDTGLSIEYVPSQLAPFPRPAIPAAILTVSQINQ